MRRPLVDPTTPTPETPMTGLTLFWWTLCWMLLGMAALIYGGVAWVIVEDEQETFGTSRRAALRMALRWPLDWWHGDRRMP